MSEAWAPQRTWTIDVEVSDHGPWNPDNPIQAADLIHTVNAVRLPSDQRPKVEVWPETGRALSVEIDGQAAVLHPGDHLVEARMPRGTYWASMTVDELDGFRPAVDA